MKKIVDCIVTDFVKDIRTEEIFEIITIDDIFYTIQSENTNKTIKLATLKRWFKFDHEAVVEEEIQEEIQEEIIPPVEAVKPQKTAASVVEAVINEIDTLHSLANYGFSLVEKKSYVAVMYGDKFLAELYSTKKGNLYLVVDKDCFNDTEQRALVEQNKAKYVGIKSGWKKNFKCDVTNDFGFMQLVLSHAAYKLGATIQW